MSVNNTNYPSTGNYQATSLFSGNAPGSADIAAAEAIDNMTEAGVPDVVVNASRRSLNLMNGLFDLLGLGGVQDAIYDFFHKDKE